MKRDRRAEVEAAGVRAVAEREFAADRALWKQRGLGEPWWMRLDDGFSVAGRKAALGAHLKGPEAEHEELRQWLEPYVRAERRPSQASVAARIGYADRSGLEKVLHNHRREHPACRLWAELKSDPPEG